jgi:Cytochrome P460
MMRRILVAGVLVFGVAALAQEPVFTKDGKLMPPKNYREWIFLSSGLGMTYGQPEGAPSANPRFDNVFVNPPAYKAFMETGKWPDKTMFVLEVRSSESHGSINKDGHYQTEDVRLSAEVKDSTRFKNGSWEFFTIPADGKPGELLPRSAGCVACHSKNGAVDNTFVQFYPTLLPVAKAKGTFSATAEK